MLKDHRSSTRKERGCIPLKHVWVYNPSFPNIKLTEKMTKRFNPV